MFGVTGSVTYCSPKPQNPLTFRIKNRIFYITKKMKFQKLLFPSALFIAMGIANEKVFLNQMNIYPFGQ
jgi:hypothetical protein